MADTVKVSKEEMASIKAENRHKEILKGLSNVLTLLRDHQSEDPAIPLLIRQTQALEKMVSTMAPVSIPAPVVTVNSNHEPVAKSIESMTQELISAIKSLESTIQQQKSVDYEFETIRDNFGRLSSVKVTTKPQLNHEQK